MPERWPMTGEWVVLRLYPFTIQTPAMGRVVTSGPHGVLLNGVERAVNWSRVWAFDTYTDGDEWRDHGDEFTQALMSEPMAVTS